MYFKMKWTKGLNLLLLYPLFILPILCCAGPATEKVYIKDEKEYGQVSGAFRSRWWNYYERGLSFLEGEFHAEAVLDFKAAIKQRSEDQRMARTYGMHFINYFPHRELGIAYYETGDFLSAKGELALSISHFPSAKARYYLDRVRKSLIEQLTRDVKPPTLTLSFKTDEVWTNEDPITLSCTVEDEHYVASIAIRGIPLLLEESKKHISFKESLNLSQGLHLIEVMAKNLAGKATTRRLRIHVDREGPIITLEELRVDQPGNSVIVKGSVYDAAGVYGLNINGQKVSIPEDIEVFFVHRLSLSSDELKLMSDDRLGNQTTALLPLSSSLTVKRPLLLAFAGSNPASCLMTGLFSPQDNDPPAVGLKGWTDTQTVFLDKIYIEGKASDENEIVRLTVNNIPVLRRQGTHIFFGHMVELKEGRNTITIQTTDEHGNTAKKQISVIRKIPRALQLTERLSLALFPFEGKGEISEAGLTFQDNLIYSLVNRNRFRVVERSRLDIVLEEQELSRTKLVDRRTALALGRLVAAQSVITGSIIESRTGIEVVAWMIDTETSDILAAEDVYSEVKDLSAIMPLAEGLAVKFHREFPLVEGEIIQKKDKYIFTDLGQDNIKIQRRLIVFRDKPVTHQVTGKKLGVDTEIVGHARVRQVGPGMSKAELGDGQEQCILQMDKVITQ